LKSTSFSTAYFADLPKPDPGKTQSTSATEDSGNESAQQVKRWARKRPHGNDDSDSEGEPPDEVRLYEDGFKNRYYESKFGVLPNDVEFRQRVAKEYTIGLCWVLRYYYQVG